MTAMGFSGAISYRATAFIVAPLLVLVVIYRCLWPTGVPTAFFRLQNGANTMEITPKDELETALEGVAMENRTLIIAILNKAYVEQNAMLDLFLQSLGEGEDTEFLIDHLLFVAVDQRAFNRCRTLELHCYKLVTEGVDFSKEVFYMSDAFNNMMWRRTLFLGDVLRRGYSFIFTDMDVMWLRNPFSQLDRDGEDLQMSSDFYYGNPFDNFNFNTGFYFVTANNKTVALFDEWYGWRNNSKGMKDQDVLQKMKKEGAFTRLGLKVRYLETTYFSGFCQMSQDSRKVITVHANCCVSMKVKLIDLRSVLEAWKVSNSNGTSNATSTAWPPSSETSLYFACGQTEITPKDELEAALEAVAMENRTLIIAILNKAYVEQNAMLDLFLQSLGEGEDTEFLVDHLLFVAVDQRAFNRCRTLELHCYNLVTEGVDFSKEVFYMSDAFNNMMWRRTLFLGDVLRRGYNFIFTDMDVMWLRNPFSQLSRDGEDLQMSSDFYYGKPFNNSNFNTGFYFVTANKKTVALFDEWYAWRNNSKGMKEQDVLQKMKKEGAFTRLGLKVRYLETAYFSGFCQMSQDLRKVITVHANCCVSMKVKLVDLRSVLEAWKVSNSNGTSNATTTAWPPVKGICMHDTATKQHIATKH
ncbi:uncharacterized protein LOC103985856 [Musa acuminata AAA Group]|uniref:uncharacterized protein LOC103985856 n=1 Tax=Musa acuminata AAA Group TaxID=214697 RepID=UPI0031E3400F